MLPAHTMGSLAISMCGIHVVCHGIWSVRVAIITQMHMPPPSPTVEGGVCAWSMRGYYITKPNFYCLFVL